ncbi:beta-galactosidase [Paenibacillus sp. GCM10027626]|uniref:beta-galactosidase n=1 Tax=Paenibacillus sp. GCM10027626 TaxID=3273411 RepID=UPI0036326ACF
MKKFKIAAMSIGCTLALITFSLGFSMKTTSAGTTTVSPFPIGIFYPPEPAETSDAAYADIANMNATFVVGTNNVVSHASNERALQYAAAHGLKLLVHDFGLELKSELAVQTTVGDGWKARSDRSIGQTFASPASGTGWYIDHVALKVDKSTLSSNVKLKLCVYDSPSKVNTVGCDAVTGPVDNDLVEFQIAPNLNPTYASYTNIDANKTYYMELQTNSSKEGAFISVSPNDSYPGGQAYLNGVPQAKDLYFEIRFSQLASAYVQGGRTSDAYLDTLVGFYKSHPALLGYNLKDEPTVDMMVRLQEAQERFKANDPTHMVFANLLPSSAEGLFGFRPMSGEYVTPLKPLGQTFRTGPNMSSINTIQMYFDRSQMTNGEALTLTLWDSPAKTAKIAESTISSASTSWPQFSLSAAVNPNTSYYMELTHNGGGDQSVGWVVRTNTGEKWEKDGTAYVGGTSIDADFWFTINQNIIPQSYEDYVYRWVSKHPDVLVYDHYPFLESGATRNDYYENLEIIRRQSLLGKIDFWSYIQSVGITGTYRVPSKEEMRYQIYTNLAYGAKGYIYFTYWTPQNAVWNEPFHDGIILPDGTKNISYTWAREINGEVLKLGPALTSLTSQAVYHTGTIPNGSTALPASFFWQPMDNTQPAVIGYFVSGSGRKYVMVVNRDTVNSRTLTFALTPKPLAVTEISKTTGGEDATDYDSATGQLSASFAPGEGKLFTLPEGY